MANRKSKTKIMHTPPVSQSRTADIEKGHPFLGIGKTPSEKKAPGFTIIEVLVAMGIFAIGFLAVAGLQIQAVQSARNARIVSQALDLADGRAEYYHAIPLYPNFSETGLSSVDRFAVPAELAEGIHEITVGGFTILSRIMDNEPLPPVSNIYTHPPLPPRVLVSKTIFIAVSENNRPGKILAEMEMVKVWAEDL